MRLGHSALVGPAVSDQHQQQEPQELPGGLATAAKGSSLPRPAPFSELTDPPVGTNPQWSGGGTVRPQKEYRKKNRQENEGDDTGHETSPPLSLLLCGRRQPRLRCRGLSRVSLISDALLLTNDARYLLCIWEVREMPS